MTRMDKMNKGLYLLAQQVERLQIPFDEDGEEVGCKHLVKGEMSIRKVIDGLLDDILELAKE